MVKGGVPQKLLDFLVEQLSRIDWAEVKRRMEAVAKATEALINELEAKFGPPREDGTCVVASIKVPEELASLGMGPEVEVTVNLGKYKALLEKLKFYLSLLDGESESGGRC